MNVKRYREKDMQSAMAKVRTELGKDAVLISSRRIDGLIEVLAANDFDPEKLKPKSETKSSTKTFQEPDKITVFPSEPVVEKTSAEVSQSPSLNEMQEEIGRLRKLFESELDQLVWREPRTRQPNRLELLARLDLAGINHDLSAKLADKVLPCENIEVCWQRAIRALVNAVKKPAHDPMQEGGVIAMVGSTGVGKTTTAVKLAAQFAKQHGRNQVAIITTDDFRPGQREQLASLAGPLGISIQVAANKHEMSQALDSVAERKLVIIDTAGVNHRSRDLKEHFAIVPEFTSGGANANRKRKISRYLVLSATVQESVTNDTIKAFAKLKPVAAIITKTDENISIGPVLSGLVRFRLPVIYVGTGQKIPGSVIYATKEFFAKKVHKSYQYFISASQKRRTATG